MYTVDLLKGEGVPIRCRPGGIAFACLLVVVPFLIGLGTVSYYLDGRVVVTIHKQQLNRLTTTIQTLSEAVQMREALERKKVRTAGLLSEVHAALDGKVQWSPILAALVENLSDTLVLTKLEARYNNVVCKVPAKSDPTMKIDMSVQVRELAIGVCGRDKQSSAEAVRKFQESLRSLPTLGPRLDTVTVSQSATTLDGEAGVLYELNCVFKPVI